MRIFIQRQIREAIAYVEDTPKELAIHLHYMVFPKSPQCFKRDVKKGLPIAHLFGQNKDLLLSTAKSLGVNVRVVERENTSRQHIDLCGKPLRKLLEKLGKNILDYKLPSKK